MNGLQPGYVPERAPLAETSAQLPRNTSAAEPMDECADDSQPVMGVPSMVGVPVHSKDPDARRAFHYQYSVASAWWQRWYQWYAKTYTGGAMPGPPYEGAPGKPGHPQMMPPVQMGMPAAMMAQPPVAGSDDGGSMHTAPMPLSDGCTHEDGMQPHSTVSSDAGKSSMLKGGEHKVCKNCGTDCTPFWRKDKNDQLPLCNACGLYAAKNGSMRPASLWRQEEGISPLPRPPAVTVGDDAPTDVPQGAFPASTAPLPSLHPSGPSSTGPSQSLSDPLHPTTSTDGGPPGAPTLTTGGENVAPAEPAATPAAQSIAQPAPAPPDQEAAPPASGAAATHPITIPPAHAAQGSNSSLPAGPAPPKSSGLPPLNKPTPPSAPPNNTDAVVSQSTPPSSAMQVVPTVGMGPSAPVAGHPVGHQAPDATAAAIPATSAPHTNTAVRVPTPSANVVAPSCFSNEGCMQLPSAAELLSGGLPPAGGVRAHSASVMHAGPGPTLMPSPMVAPYNARFVQLGTIGHGPQQYPIVQFAGPGGAMPKFTRPQRTRSDAQSTLPPLPPLATSAPPLSKQPPGPFVAMPHTGVSAPQRSKRTKHTAKAKRFAAQKPAVSDSTPMVHSPQLTPRCTEMGSVEEVPFGQEDEDALRDADDAAFDPAELEALFNDDIVLDLQEEGCKSNVFAPDANALGDLDCGVSPFRDEDAPVRAHSAPDPFGFP